MKFVTKEEFDKSVATIQLAVENGQVQSGHYENPEEVVQLFFGGKSLDPVFSVDVVSFVAPIRAAENKLLRIRNKLNKFKEYYNTKTKELEFLEKEEQAISNILTKLKKG
jgi:hypothetical protein